MLDFVGKTLGHYRIEASIGRGELGQVVRGVHVSNKQPVAIKIVHPYLATRADFRSRFDQATQVAAELKHPNIVEIYEVKEQDNLLYIVMELVPDGSICTLIQHNTWQSIPLTTGLDLLYQAATGLASAQTMLHQDIKPDTLLLKRLQSSQQSEVQYQLKISDFGLAHLIQNTYTGTGVPTRALSYKSPEQCQCKRLDGRSDIYALGVVLYEIVTGYLPFQINNFDDALNKHMQALPPRPGQERPDLPREVEEIILRCLAKNPDERYRTSAELAQALQKSLATIIHQKILSSDTYVKTPLSSENNTPQAHEISNTFLPQEIDTEVPCVRVLDQQGKTLRVVEMSKDKTICIGRQSSNDIILSSPTVSRQHLQITWDGIQTVVQDVGSHRGTHLGKRELQPHESQLWTRQEMIRIDTFCLLLERSSQEDRQLVDAMAMQGRIGIAIDPITLTITPGQTSTIRVTLTNLGTVVDWFTTLIEGVSPAWIQGAGQEVSLNPAWQEIIELNVHVARVTDNIAGKYPVIIRARSRKQPGESSTIQTNWEVLPFHEALLSLEPRRTGGRGTASSFTALQNNSNVRLKYSLSGEDDERSIIYRFGKNPITLEPGQQTRIPFTLQTRRCWIGREQHQSFSIHAQSAQSKLPLHAQGEFVNKALLPPWLFSMLSVVLLGSSIFLALFAHLLPSGAEQPPPTSEVVLIHTPTALPTATPTPTATPIPTPTVAPPPPPAAQYAGTWVNENPATDGISQLIIKNMGQILAVHSYALCSSRYCDWGIAYQEFHPGPFIITYVFDGSRPGACCLGHPTAQITITFANAEKTKLRVVAAKSPVENVLDKQ